MKKQLIIFLMLGLWLTTAARTPGFYASESVLSSGKLVKIQVSESGIYRLTYEEIAAQGLQPENIRVLGYGGNMLPQNFTLRRLDDVPSVAFYMHKGEDHVFGKGDYILFYARGPIGWEYNGSTFIHTRNPYSNYGYYFLSDAAGEQLLMEDAAVPSTFGTKEINYSLDYILHEKEMLNLVDVNGKEGGGREFYGESMTPNKPTLAITFPLNDLLPNLSGQARVMVAANSTTTSTFTFEMGSVKKQAYTSGIEDFYTMATTATLRVSDIPQSGGSLNTTITYSNSMSSAKAYLNFIEMTGRCRLSMKSPYRFFRNTDYIGSSIGNLFTLTGANDQTQVWDITFPESIQRMSTTLSHDTLQFISANDTVHEYVAVQPNASGYPTPTIIGTVVNQNLHRLRDIDYVIVTPAAFYADAMRLAQAHEQIDGYTYAVVTDEQIYNEFSSGTPDISAIRWFMKMLYDCASTPENRPKNLLLMGTGTFDNRKLLASSGNATLLTYQAENSTVETKAYASDDYLAFMADNDGVNGSYFSDMRGRMAFGVGRMPVATGEQAANVVNKTIMYMTNLSHGNWRQQTCFLADDGDHGLHVQVSDIAAEPMRIKNPSFIINKIYLDAYVQETSASGETYPLALNQFNNLMQNGMLFMDYSGHGSANNICSEGFLTIDQVKKLTNANLGFWALATCNFSHFDQANACSAAEAVLNPYGGAIGVFSADRTVYASNNKILNKNLCDTLFGHANVFHYDMTIGQACAAAKNMTGNDENKMPYVLFGDPAIRLAYPTQYEVVTTQIADTLHALDRTIVQGYIRTEDSEAQRGDTATWFNGRLVMTVYDKLQQITTRDNDEPDASKKSYYTYNDYPNCLFKGETVVTNGHFALEFMLPKDIRYQYDYGRMVYYAVDTVYQDEAIGYEDGFMVGGSSSLHIVDTMGPDLHIYLNNPSFVSGDPTNETPHFYASIYDDNGINTVGSGIGHDLMLVIDEDPNQTFILNDYFTATVGSYRQGQVSYLLSEQSSGMHRLHFRAWDLMNNSSTASLNYEVVKGLEVQLYQVIAYPNPVASDGVLHIRVSHDKPDDYLHTCLRIYDISGHLTRMIEEDGADLDLNMSSLHLAPGIYLYQLNIKTSTTGYVTQTARLIVH